MFWHNDSVVSVVFFRLSYSQYAKVLEENTKGNFLDMTKAINTDVNMLFHINEHQIPKKHPMRTSPRAIEIINYRQRRSSRSRDYSTFTDQDVREMAQVLIRWKIIGTELDT